MASWADLLLWCCVQVRPSDEYMVKGPSFIFLFNPCLGPLWSVISQKVRGGKIAEGSELCLEVADVYCKDLDLNGSLIVHALSVAGHKEATGREIEDEENKAPLALPLLASDSCKSGERVVFSESCGRIFLRDLKVVNEGIDWSHPDNVYWEHKVVRKEAMRVILRGWSEFDARNVTIPGDRVFDVPDGYKMVVRKGPNGEITENLRPLEKAEWSWKYHLSADDTVTLSWEETE